MNIPTSLADAEARRQQITLEVQGIQAQLGDKQRLDENGNRLSSHEYWAWRKRAQHALNQKLGELRMLRAWIKDNRPVVRQTARHDLLHHLSILCEIIRVLREDDVDFDKEELEKIVAAEKAVAAERAVATEPAGAEARGDVTSFA